MSDATSWACLIRDVTTGQAMTQEQAISYALQGDEHMRNLATDGIQIPAVTLTDSLKTSWERENRPML